MASIQTTVPSSANLFSPLNQPDYRWFWISLVLGMSADFFQTVVLAPMVIDLTGSAAGWSSVLVVSTLPRAILMLGGGVATDRFHPRTVMAAASVLQFCACAGLAATVAAGFIRLPFFYVYAVLFGVGGAFYLPATGAMSLALLPPAQLRSANALSMITVNLARFLAPPAAGAITAWAGRAPALAANAALFAATALTLMPIQVRRQAPAVATPLWRQVEEGLDSARRDDAVWSSIVGTAIFSLGHFGGLFVGIPAMAKLVFGAGDAGLGILLGASGAGALVGAAVTGIAARVPRQGLVGSLIVVGAGITMAAVGLSPSLWWAVLWLTLNGLSVSASVIIFGTVVQLRAPAQVRGRVIALQSLAMFGLNPVSFALAGPLSDLIGPGMLVVICGITTACAGLFQLSRPSVRSLA